MKYIWYKLEVVGVESSVKTSHWIVFSTQLLYLDSMDRLENTLGRKIKHLISISYSTLIQPWIGNLISSNSQTAEVSLQRTEGKCQQILDVPKYWWVKWVIK